MEVAVLATPVNTPEPADTIAPMVAETVEPEEVTDFNAAPVPHVLSFERPSAPTQRPRPQQPAPTQQATSPAPQKLVFAGDLEYRGLRRGTTGNAPSRKVSVDDLMRAPLPR